MIFIKFFFRQLNLVDFSKIFLNYFIVLFVTFLEIIFIGMFFLVINGEAKINFNSYTLNLVSVYLDKYLILYYSFSVLQKIEIIILVLLLKNTVQAFQIYYSAHFINTITASKITKAYSNYLNLLYVNFQKKNISTYTKNTIRDVENIFLGLFNSVIIIFSDLLYILLIILFCKDFLLFSVGFYGILFFFFICVIIFILFRVSLKLGQIRNKREYLVYKILNETFSAFKEIKISQSAIQFVTNFSKNVKSYYNSKSYSSLLQYVPKYILEIMVCFFLYFIYSQNSLTVDDFFKRFSVVALILYRVAPLLSRTFSNISNSLFLLESFKSVHLDLSLDSKNFKSLVIKKNIKIQKIFLKNINHKFEKNNEFFEIYKNFNFTFEKGRIYGIYGSSGSGKTTLLSFICGLLKPDKGSIYINNKKISFYELHKKYHFSLLSQNPYIMDDSIATNVTLRFNNTFEDLERIKIYLKEFNLDKFNNNTYLSNRDLSFIKKTSDGEKQRIGFIRSIFNNPDILLLDEPTSSLDSKNEKIIFNYLNKIKKNKIIIVTSHKYNQEKYFDKIIQL